MKKIFDVRSDVCPPEIKVTPTQVFVTSNIVEYTKEINDKEEHGYKYDYTIYTKDQYILLIAQQTKAIEQLQDELQAAKILLGVDD